MKFEFHPTIRVIHGNGALLGIGTLAKELKASRVLFVTDSGIRKAGHAERAIASLREAGLTVFVFDEIQENPTTADVVKGTRFAEKQGGIDLIATVGGGSVMDTAKGINFLFTNGGRMEDYWGFGKASRPMLPSIGVPTTAGTGSEAQSYALIEQEESRRKMACGDLKARFSAVILDPELTVTAPFQVTAVSGMDAMTHAIESYVSTARSPISQMYAREAWRLLELHYERVLKEPANLEVRGAMLLGSHLAGMAIEASMLGAAHACANPLTSRYGVTHGIAVGLMLPHVIRCNAQVVGPLYTELLIASGAWDPERSAAEQLTSRIRTLLQAGKLPQKLKACGVQESSIDELGRDASEQWTGTFNPRPLTQSDYVELYRHAF